MALSKQIPPLDPCSVITAFFEWYLRMKRVLFVVCSRRRDTAIDKAPESLYSGLSILMY